MVSLDIIIEVGKALRKSNQNSISIENLYMILERNTGSHTKNTLKGYIETLIRQEYIKSKYPGVFEIIK